MRLCAHVECHDGVERGPRQEHTEIHRQPEDGELFPLGSTMRPDVRVPPKESQHSWSLA